MTKRTPPIPLPLFLFFTVLHLTCSSTYVLLVGGDFFFLQRNSGTPVLGLLSQEYHFWDLAAQPRVLEKSFQQLYSYQTFECFFFSCTSVRRNRHTVLLFGPCPLLDQVRQFQRWLQYFLLGVIPALHCTAPHDRMNVSPRRVGRLQPRRGRAN